MLHELIALLLGSGLFWGYFHHGEHHLYGPTYVQIASACFLFATFSRVYLEQCAFPDAVYASLRLAGCILVGIYSNLLLYRLVLSPLNRFPGPFGARVGAIWFSLRLGRLQAFKQLEKLHQQYGPYLRIGPNTISITDPRAVPAIFGQRSACIKADWYDSALPSQSLQLIRDRAQHDRRRKLWSNAFSDKALRSYEQRVAVCQARLLDILHDRAGISVNVTDWIARFSWDAMGDLAFGHNFGTLESGEPHWAQELMRNGALIFGLLIPTWLLRLVISMPGVSRDFWRMLEFSRDQVADRRERNVEIPDVMSHLIANFEESEQTFEDLNALNADSVLVIIAGTDTTSSTLINSLYELIRHPAEIDRLRNEIISAVIKDQDQAKLDVRSLEIRHQDLASLEQLNAVIHETLRLHPPTPSAVQRITPPEGLRIGNDVYIPGRTNVYCPAYVIGRSADTYEDPIAFRPERWTTHSEMVKDKQGFAPFSLGPFNCIGRPLAMLTLRTTLAQLLLQFDVGFAPGETGRGIEEETIDHFTLDPGPLNLVFTPRK